MQCARASRPKLLSRVFAIAVASASIALAAPAASGSAVLSFSDTLYVATNGNNNNSGRSPEQSVATIFQALQLTERIGGRVLILIAPGTYRFEPFPLNLPSRLTLRGAGGMQEVIIDGSRVGNQRLFNLKLVRDVAIENMTLVNGRTSNLIREGGSGGAIFVQRSRDCRFADLILTNNYAEQAGGAIYAREDTNTVIANCVISGNHAGYGGALYWRENINGILLSCEITQNIADSISGAIYIDLCSPRLSQNRIYHNRKISKSRNGAGGITVISGKPIIGGSWEDSNDIFGNIGSDRGADLWVRSGDDLLDARYNFWGQVPSGATHDRRELIDMLPYRLNSILLPAQVRDFYVSPLGSDNNLGISPQRPWRTLSHGLSLFFAIASDSATLHIANGTYAPDTNGEKFPINLPSHTTFLNLDHGAVFDGSAAGPGSIFVANQSTGVVLRGLTIQNNRSDDFAAVHLKSTSGVTIADCRFIDNTGYLGGAIAISQSGQTRIFDNVFSGNRAERGGALWAANDNSEVRDNRFNGNFARRGGAVALQEASRGTYNNNLLTHNAADSGGAFALSASSPYINNNRIIFNSARHLGGAILLDAASQPQISGHRSRPNDIFANTATLPGSQIFRLGEGAVIDARYNYWGKVPDASLLFPLAQFNTEDFRQVSAMLPADARDFFVSPNGSNENSGLSRESPWRYIDHALLMGFGRQNSPITLHIGRGHYAAEHGDTFPLLLKNYTLLSGDAGDRPVLDAAGASRIVVAENLQAITLKHLILRNGKHESSGGAMLARQVESVTIEQSIFEGNSAEYGGGLALERIQQADLTGVRFEHNVAAQSGGAIFAREVALLRMTASALRQNTAVASAGGLAALGSTVQIQQSFVTQNKAAAAAGLHLNGTSNSTIGGSLAAGNDIYGNRAETGIGTQVLVENSQAVKLDGNYWGRVPSEAQVAGAGVVLTSFRQVSARVPADRRRFYFSPGGDDNNRGYIDTEPWQRIAHGLELTFGLPDSPVRFYLLPGQYTSQGGQAFPIAWRSWMELLSTASANAPVILDAGGQSRVLELVDVEQALIAGLTIRGGRVENGAAGAGILLHNSREVRLENLAIRENQNYGGSGGGAAVAGQSQAIQFQRVTFTQNLAGHGGGLAILDADSVSLSGCVFVENEGIGGAVYAGSGHVYIAAANFRNNRSPRPGSAIYWDSASRGLLAQSQVRSNRVLASDTSAAIAIAPTSHPVIGGAPGRGNDIVANEGGQVGRALAILGRPAGERIDARHNYFSAETISTALAVPLDAFDFSQTRDVSNMENLAPVVTAIHPEPGALEVAAGQSLHFEITITDPDGDPLQFLWLLNGAPAGSEATYMLPAQPTSGQHKVDLRVSDGPNTLDFTWLVTIRGSVTSTGETAPTLPTAFFLHQNTPNPFNPETLIRYDLPHAAHVRLAVYDLHGRLVSTLVDAVLMAGRQQTVWRGENSAGQPVASGMYLLHLQADGVLQQRKILLLR